MKRGEGQMKVNFHNKMTEFAEESAELLKRLWIWTPNWRLPELSQTKTVKTRRVRLEEWDWNQFSSSTVRTVRKETRSSKNKKQAAINAVRRTQWNVSVQFAGFGRRWGSIALVEIVGIQWIWIYRADDNNILNVFTEYYLQARDTTRQFSFITFIQ